MRSQPRTGGDYVPHVAFMERVDRQTHWNVGAADDTGNGTASLPYLPPGDSLEFTYLAAG